MDTGMGIPVTVLRREAVCRIRDGTVLTSTKLEAPDCQMQPESASATQYAPAMRRLAVPLTRNLAI
jgi:hypothetical protein